jgi:hypothetical protein
MPLYNFPGSIIFPFDHSQPAGIVLSLVRIDVVKDAIT